MSALPETRMTVSEYLAFERAATERHAFLDGEIFAMTGASRRHNVINLNIASLLLTQVRTRGCEVYSSDMRVKVSETGLYTYPDIAVACGEPTFEDDELDSLLNPSVIVEVLSPSTEDHDRGGKFVHYRSIPSVADYLLVAQDRPHVEHFARQADGRWLLTEHDDREAVIELDSIGAQVTLDMIYERVPGL